jgi:hypothetical protein
MDYFHNGGFFRVEGENFTGVFQLNQPEGTLPFLPYTEFAKFPERQTSPAHQRDIAAMLLQRHFARRPSANPIAAFAAVFPAQVEAIAERPFGYFHKYAFNTLRQFGANFELLASHLTWLDHEAHASAVAEALKVSENAKTVQFQLARAIARKKFDPLAAALDPAIAAWDRLMDDLGSRLI